MHQRLYTVLVKIQCKTDTFGLDLRRGFRLRGDKKVKICFYYFLVVFSGVFQVTMQLLTARFPLSRPAVGLSCRGRCVSGNSSNVLYLKSDFFFQIQIKVWYMNVTATFLFTHKVIKSDLDMCASGQCRYKFHRFFCVGHGVGLGTY